MSKQTYILLLRGVNVGGTGKIQMAELRSQLEKAGYPGAKTYIQTGNIVLECEQGAEVVKTAVQDVIETGFGFRPMTVVLTIKALQNAIQRNPFEVEDKRFLHLTFLSSDVTLDAEGLSAFCTAAETFHLGGSVFYLATPGGYGRSKAAEKLDKFLIADVKTARNLNSCEKILALAQSL